MEFAKRVVGYCNYTVSKQGIVFGVNGELKQRTEKTGYKRVQLNKFGKRKNFLVHRLVYETFLGPIPEGYQIDHIDHDKTNNHIDNLRALPASVNMARKRG